VETQFKNKHEVRVSTRTLSELKYKCHISDYLVKLKDLICEVELAGYIFWKQANSQIPSEFMDMVYTIRPIPMKDDEFLRVLELARIRV
jgi:hypothetical protein